MWHESAVEMTCMLKSIFRMDEDQCARRNAQKYLKVYLLFKNFYLKSEKIQFFRTFEKKSLNFLKIGILDMERSH